MNTETLVDAYLVPLSEFIRPKTLGEYIGQRHLVDLHHGQISGFLLLGYLPSMILSGPPGVGKTTIASILAAQANYVFIELSATDATVAVLKELLQSICDENRKRATTAGRDKKGRLRVAVFIDEIHRFTKIQQDFLLPFLENGDFVFIGATTVEPHKRLKKAILSRCQIFCLKALEELDSLQIIQRSILFENIRRKRHKGLCFLKYSDSSVLEIAKFANGDMRSGINSIELISTRYCKPVYKKVQAGEFFLLDDSEVKSILASLSKTRLGLKDEANLLLINRLLEFINGSHFKTLEELTPAKRSSNRFVSINRTNESLFVTFNISKFILASLEMEHIVPCSAHDGKFQYNSQQKQWLERMNLSDDSDEDLDEQAPNSFRTEILDAARLCHFWAVYTMVVLIENGESVHLLLKYLILYTCLFTTGNSNELVTVVSAAKSINKASVEPLHILSDCVDYLVSMDKRPESLLAKQIEYIKHFLSSEGSNVAAAKDFKLDIFKVVYDSELEDELLKKPEYKARQVLENKFQVEFVPESELEGSEFTCGLDPPFF